MIVPPAKDKGRKRFIVTDTLGLLVVVCVRAASWQDRDGGKTALLSTYLGTPIRYVFADQGPAGRLVDWAWSRLRTTVDIVRKPAEQRGFAVHPRRWVVERTLAWLTAHRRLARDYERDPAVSEHMIRWAAISGMLNRLTRGGPAVRQTRYVISPTAARAIRTFQLWDLRPHRARALAGGFGHDPGGQRPARPARPSSSYTPSKRTATQDESAHLRRPHAA